MTIHWRLDGMAENGPVRVWSDEQARYGQFDVMEAEDFQALKRIAEKYKWNLIEHWD